jgi:hypothetical protein
MEVINRSLELRVTVALQRKSSLLEIYTFDSVLVDTINDYLIKFPSHTTRICVLVLLIHKGYFVAKKGVKSFLYLYIISLNFAVYLYSISFLQLSTSFIHNSSEMSVWDGVVVNPLERAYEKPADMTGEEDMEAEEGDMEAE